MRRRVRSSLADKGSGAVAIGAGEIVRIKVWLIGVSPMIWRRLLVPASLTLRELHGVIHVAMGWEGIHLYEFRLRAARYGSWELSASSPDVTLVSLRLRLGVRFIYEYDLNIPWRHEIRLEGKVELKAGGRYPICIAGSGACPPEDCGGPEAFMEHRDDLFSLEGREDLATMAEVMNEVVSKRRLDVLDDEETRWRVEEAPRA